MSKIKATRFHDFSYGHRVVGHESKCKHLHGHNGRVHFTCEAINGNLDSVGRVIDFTAIKEKLCMWVENNWDHKFLAWEHDEVIDRISDVMSREFHMGKLDGEKEDVTADSLVFVPFNPTAENMAEYLVNVIGPQQLLGTGIVLSEVKIEETAKCSATYSKG